MSCNSFLALYEMLLLKISQSYRLLQGVLQGLLQGLISNGENSEHFFQLMPFTIFRISFHQIPITVGGQRLLSFCVSKALCMSIISGYKCAVSQSHVCLVLVAIMT